MHSKNAIVYLAGEIVGPAEAWLGERDMVVHRARSAREIGSLCDAHEPDLFVLEGPLGGEMAGVEIGSWLRNAGLTCPIVFHCGSKTEAGALAAQAHLQPFSVVTGFTSESDLDLQDDPGPSRGPLPESGDLAQWSVADVLLDCFDRRWTGKIEIENGSTSKTLFMEDGRPVYCSSNIFSENFGQMLLREGIITEVEYEWARKVQLREGIRQGEALVKIGVLTSRKLHEHLRAQIREKLVNAFGWAAGTFRMVPDHGFVHHTTRFQFNPLDIVVAGRARFIVRDDLRSMWQRLAPGWAVCVCDSGRVCGVVDECLEDGAVRALATPTMLCEIAIDNGWNKARALATFLSLEAMGYIRIADRPQRLPASSPITPVRFDEIQVGGETYLAVDVLSEAPEEVEMTEQELGALADDLWSAYLKLTSSDHFAALGVDSDASAAEVMTARDELLAVYSREAFSPLMSDRRSANALSEVRAKLNASADVLLNATARKEYMERLALKSGPEVSKYLSAEDEFVEGMVKLGVGDAESAKEHFRAAREFNNQEPVYEMYYGWTLFCCAANDSDVEVAKRHLIRAIASNPLLDDGYVFLAKLFLHEGDEDEAREQARTALAFNPDNEDAKALLASSRE